MSSLKMIFLLLVFLLGGLWETEAVSVTGVLGREVMIKCSHSNAFSNVKYFCKGACRYEDILISSSKKETDSNGRYSIKDQGNTFNVTISGLTKDDAGTYWCGIERYGVDTYNEVILVIEEKNRGFPPSYVNALSFQKVVYIVAGLGVVVLALAMVLLIFFRRRNRHINASSGKDHDTVYAAPCSQKQDRHHITTSSSTDHEDRGTDTQPDGLFYSTVSFNKHTDCSSVAPRTAPLTYSTIKHKAADESVVYDNV